MKIKIKAALVAVLLLVAGASHAAKEPRPGTVDARIRSVVYHPREVVEVRGHFGFTTVIEFDASERVGDMGIGDSAAWQVAVAGSGSSIMIKPIEHQAVTNLFVTTDKRSYMFVLRAVGDVDRFGVPVLPRGNVPSDVIFRVAFVYPDEPEVPSDLAAVALSEPSSPESMNFRYSWSGSPPTKPLRVFDNGEFTYFAFADGQSVPAIFSVDADGNEALVNHHVRGEYVVVERLGSQFSLRSGDFVTCIFNDLRPHPSAKRSKERTPL